MNESWKLLQHRIIRCERCPRLRAYCSDVAREKRASFRNWNYWGKPVPNFGDDDAWLLLVGLAPAAHGANRTGRMFTGDRSGDFLYEALYACGLANQPTATHANDGLMLKGVAITAAAHCAPPGNKPLPEELEACSVHMDDTFACLPRLRALLCLGQIGYKVALKTLIRQGIRIPRPAPKFAHGAIFDFAVPQGGPLVACTYHPSQQNTFTGLLTQGMLQDVIRAVTEQASSNSYFPHEDVDGKGAEI